MNQSTVEAVPTVQYETGESRVTRWDFPPSSATGMHVHEFDYVVVPVTDGVLTITDPAGAVTEAPLSAGVAYGRSAGVEHNVENRTSAPIAFVEVELLEHPIEPAS